MAFRVFLNELSLRELPDESALHQALKSIVDARSKSPNLKRALYCSRQTADFQGRTGDKLIVMLQRMQRDDRNLVLGWLSKYGPFLEDEREEIASDLFHLFGEEVTDHGPGEAARCRLRKLDGSLLSFTGSFASPYSLKILDVVQGFPEDPVDTIAVPNFCDLVNAQQAADEADPEPNTWEELLDVSRRRFGHLQIGDHCEGVLRTLPFYPAVSRRSLELLRILNDIMNECDVSGGLSAAGESLRQQYFVGENAWFSDEADGNKQDFASEMTFPDPDKADSKIQCFWHGKIRSPQFRIHFQWPIPAGAKKLKVVYLGPKISKR